MEASATSLESVTLAAASVECLICGAERIFEIVASNSSCLLIVLSRQMTPSKNKTNVRTKQIRKVESRAICITLSSQYGRKAATRDATPTNESHQYTFVH